MDLRLEPFRVTIVVNIKDYPMWVCQTYLSNKAEQFTLMGGKKFAVIENNRPSLRLQNDMRRELSWRDISGKFKPEVFKHIVGILETHIYAREHPEIAWTRIMLGTD